MRITRVTNVNYKGALPSFGRKGANKKSAAQTRQTQQTETKPQKAPVPYNVRVKKRDITALDMDKIMSIDIEETEADKPVSFENSHQKFKTDKYQQEAIEAYCGGKSPIICAPTGTGKTLIAEYAIKDALEKDKRIIYTSPMKALSNEKYTDLCKLFGDYDEDGNLTGTDNVGLVTGDVTINPKAPVVVMTTEVYRNLLLSMTEDEAKEYFKDYDGVIYDEFHYLGDYQRGPVWEEAVMFTPNTMKQLMLSATASNAKEIARWVQNINPDIETKLVNVPESERHVPLKEYVLTEDSETGQLKLEPTKEKRIPLENITNSDNLTERQKQAFDEALEITGLETGEELIAYLKPFGQKGSVIGADVMSKGLMAKGAERDRANAIPLILSDEKFTKTKTYTKDPFAVSPKLSQAVKLLHEEQMDPALFYIFSKNRCENEFDYAVENAPTLLTPEESKMVYDEIKKSEDSGIYLGANFDQKEIKGLMKGYAVHHAGRLPAYKSLVETLARKGLIKACFATETLIAGINMPFKTTVFTELDKYSDETNSRTDISTSTFKQGAGRAGRRGKDEIGNVVVITPNYDRYDEYVSLTNSTDTSIVSREAPSYATCLSDRVLNNREEYISKSLASSQRNGKPAQNAAMTEEKMSILKNFGFIEETAPGHFERTERGEIAGKVYGMNEIVMAELLTDESYLKGLNSDELTAIFASFADIKDEEPKREFTNGLSYLNTRMKKIDDLVSFVETAEECSGVSEEGIKMSTTLAPYIVEFANAPNSREDSIEVWKNIMTNLIDKELIKHEGDFLRVINNTKSILRMVSELSPDKMVASNARLAMQNLEKSPVVDVLNYELNLDKTPIPTEA